MCFRCELDGSNLEVFASGLRNPQDLAFDRFGNLFSVDNNSDHEDQARVVYITEGSDAGWRMHYQHLADRGPFVRERLWQPHFEGQAAYIVPPIANYTVGPSGLAYYPGLGLPDRYDDHFFICDFRGTALGSGVKAFSLKNEGAFFELDKTEDFLVGVLATDVEFSAEGHVYVSDWINGWGGVGQGRIWKFAPKTPVPAAPSPALSEITELPNEKLLDLLGHEDSRVRLRSQVSLAERGALEELLAVARESTHQQARIQAIWGLGQLARRGQATCDQVLSLLTDSDPEIRAQVAKTLSDYPHSEASKLPLLGLLADPTARVQYFAARALGHHGNEDAVGHLLGLLMRSGEDLLLRHAVVQSLTELADAEVLLSHLEDDSPREVRLALLLALRKLRAPQIARFLADADPHLVLEAARAIHDVDIPEAMAALATLDVAILENVSGDVADPLARRVVNAAYRLAMPQEMLAWITAEKTPPEVARQGWRSLLEWREPDPLDIVTGEYRPLPADRDTAELAALLQAQVPRELGQISQPGSELLRVAGYYRIESATEQIAGIAADEQQEVEFRVAAFEALGAIGSPGIEPLAQELLQSSSAELRIAALKLLVKAGGKDAVALLQRVLEHDGWRVQQAAIDLLAAQSSAESESLLEQLLAKLATGDLPPELQLEILEAAELRNSPGMLQAVLDWQQAQGVEIKPKYVPCQVGGDPAKGRKVFFERMDLSCSRCHKAEGLGLRVGPNLSAIGKEKSPEYIVQSIVDPNKQLAEGFESTVLVTDEGITVTGVLQSETEEALELMLADGTSRRLMKSEIEARTKGLSAMPVGLGDQMTRRDLRDLVAYLSTLKTPASEFETAE